MLVGLELAQNPALAYIGIAAVYDVGTGLHDSIIQFLHGIERQSVVAVHVHHIVGSGMLQCLQARGSQASVAVLADNGDLSGSLRKARHHLAQHADAAVARAVVNKDVFNVGESLRKQALSTLANVVFNAVDRQED